MISRVPQSCRDRVDEFDGVEFVDAEDPRQFCRLEGLDGVESDEFLFLRRQSGEPIDGAERGHTRSVVERPDGVAQPERDRVGIAAAQHVLIGMVGVDDLTGDAEDPRPFSWCLWR